MLNNKKILIVRLSSIGDTIHTLPMVYSLKKTYPNCKIGWVVESKAKLFVENNPYVDKCFIIDKKRKNLFKVIKKIRKEKYDIALDPQQLLKSGIILGLCGANKKITLTEGREFSWIFANKVIKSKRKLFDTEYHVIKRNLELCEYLKCDTTEIEFPMPKITEKEREDIYKLLPKNTKQNIALSPATTWRNKHLPTTFWVKIIKHLENRANIIFTGSIKDASLINHIIEKSHIKEYTNLVGETDLLELKELYTHCKLVITPDSGSAHIAWAAKEPSIITLFCSTSAKRTGPFSDIFPKKYLSIQSNISCSPCMKRKCYKQKNKDFCIKNFNIKEILKYVDEFIK